MITDEQWADSLIEAAERFADQGQQNYAKIHYQMAIDELMKISNKSNYLELKVISCREKCDKIMGYSL